MKSFLRKNKVLVQIGFGTCDVNVKGTYCFLFKLNVLIKKNIHNLLFYCMCAKLKAWKEQRACWESQKDELEQRVEDGEEKADKLEK